MGTEGQWTEHGQNTEIECMFGRAHRHFGQRPQMSSVLGMLDHATLRPNGWHEKPDNHDIYLRERNNRDNYWLGSRINVTNQRTCDTLMIQDWEPCPFWLRMTTTSSVRPTGLIRNLDITIRGHVFRISAVVLQLNVQGAYPLFLGRPWLWTAHIKQNWQKNVITFRRVKTKVHVTTQPGA